MRNTVRTLTSCAALSGLLLATAAHAASPPQGIYNFTGTVLSAKATGGASCPATAEAASGDAVISGKSHGQISIHVLASPSWPAFGFQGRNLLTGPAVEYNHTVSGALSYTVAPFAAAAPGSFAITAVPGKGGAFTATLTTVTGPLGGTVKTAKTATCTVSWSLSFTPGVSNKLQTFFKSIL